MQLPLLAHVTLLACADLIGCLLNLSVDTVLQRSQVCAIHNRWVSESRVPQGLLAALALELQFASQWRGSAHGGARGGYVLPAQFVDLLLHVAGEILEALFELSEAAFVALYCVEGVLNQPRDELLCVLRCAAHSVECDVAIVQLPLNKRVGLFVTDSSCDQGVHLVQLSFDLFDPPIECLFEPSRSLRSDAGGHLFAR